MSAGRRCAGTAVGLLADRVLGEPPVRPHPVAAFGSAMGALEARWWADDRAAGARHALAGVALGAGAGAVVRSTALATYVAAAGRGLADAARVVGGALDRGDLDAARAGLSALAGRDPFVLNGQEVTRAVVESVAENTVDAVVAPALWGGVAGAPGVFGHRAVNTLDAMVGHRSPRHTRFGWASARLDDVAAWPAARLTALLVALVRPRAAARVARVVRRDGARHPSPNAGVAEAAFAAALGVRLGGPLSYGGRTEHRPFLGDGPPPEPGDIERAVRLSLDVGLAAAGALLAAARVAPRRAP